MCAEMIFVMAVLREWNMKVIIVEFLLLQCRSAILC